MTILLADTSVWARRSGLGRSPTGGMPRRLEDSIAITPMVRLEVLYTGRSARDYVAIDAGLDALHQVPCDEAAFARALGVQQALAQQGGLHHRSVGIADLLIAAAAELAGATVWHYDEDFDRIAEVTGQPTEWIVPRRLARQPARKLRRTLAVGVVDVGVDQHDRLPGAQREAAVEDRHRDAGRDERRQHVVGAVAGRTVAVPPAGRPRQQVVERPDQVVVAAGAGLDDRHAGGGVGHEHRRQAVAPPGRSPRPRRYPRPPGARRCGR